MKTVGWPKSRPERSSRFATLTNPPSPGADVFADFDSHQSPEEEELDRKKQRLAEVEAQLAERELELASLLADLFHFEKHYLHVIGRRYAILDDLKAKIAEVRAQRNPGKPEMSNEAREAREKADESARASGQEDTASIPPPPPVEEYTKPNRSESLKKLYKEAVFLLHPDRTLDWSAKEQKRRHSAWIEMQAAYERSDERRIREILREWHAAPENVQGDGPGAELVRVIRRIAQAEKRLKAIAVELEKHREGELSQLKQSVDEARTGGQDLLKELASQLDQKIAAARDEFERATRDAL